MIQDAFDHDPLYKYLRKTPVSRRATPSVQPGCYRALTSSHRMQIPSTPTPACDAS